MYHLTSRANLPVIQRTRALESASELARKGGRPELIRLRRREHEPVTIDGVKVWLRDQAPLHANNMRLEDGWSFDQYVEHLNERVYFWPGDVRGPSVYGRRHYERYASERPILLRTLFADLAAMNPARVPLFAKFNSGSPRASGGVKPIRGSSTFVPADRAPFQASESVEVTFKERVRLPEGIEVGDHPDGPWSPLDRETE